MMRLLIDAGADVNNLSYPWGHATAALMYSVIKGGEHTAKTTHILVNAGADINRKSVNNQTAYDFAVYTNNQIAVNIFNEYKNNWIFKWTAKNKFNLNYGLNKTLKLLQLSFYVGEILI